MHTWYIALVFQYYIVYALLLWYVIKFSKDKNTAISITVCIIFVLSLLLYIFPLLTFPQKFYFLPARFFEFAAGGIVVLFELKIWQFRKTRLVIILFSIIVLILSLNVNLEIEQIKLLSIVFITQIILSSYTLKIRDLDNNWWYKIIKVLSYFGIGSYSLYLWHQVIIAFYRYVFNYPLSCSDYIIIFIICILIGIISYQLFEKKLTKILSSNNFTQRIGLLVCCLITLALVSCSAYVYQKQGLIRDVPELDLYVDSDKNMSPEDYNSLNFCLDVDFPSNSKKNALVIGDSFARDWINILKESHVDSILNLSYHTDVDSILTKRIKEADYIFVANNGDFDIYYPLLREMMKKKFYRVGCKYFTKRVGIVYNNKRQFKNEYYSQSFCPDKLFEEKIKRERAIFGESYIDMMTIIKDERGNYPHFTPDYHLYSEDGIHLTKAGAKEYAKRLNVIQYIK